MVFLFDNKCKITDFKSVNLVQPTHVILSMKNNNILVEGNNLRIVYYSQDELIIAGEILMVKLDA